MTEGWSSDWEKLFAKCVADADYRRQLLAALDQGIDDTAYRLLDSIGVAGSTEQRSTRLSALRALKGPLAAASDAFGAPLQTLAAP
jgi:hypothetical protein